MNFGINNALAEVFHVYGRLELLHHGLELRVKGVTQMHLLYEILKAWELPVELLDQLNHPLEVHGVVAVNGCVLVGHGLLHHGLFEVLEVGFDGIDLVAGFFVIRDLVKAATVGCLIGLDGWCLAERLWLLLLVLCHLLLP